MKSLAVCVVDRRWLSYHVALTVLALSVPFVAPFVASTAQQASSRSAGKLTQWEVWLLPLSSRAFWEGSPFRQRPLQPENWTVMHCAHCAGSGGERTRRVR